MQAKINSFFKASPSSSIAISDSDDCLAAWEKNRNAIANSYERRRSPIVKRDEALKGFTGKPRRKGSKDVNKKRNYTQFHLELGQSDFLLRHCTVCGAKYTPGDELDEKSHQSFHKNYTNGITFKGWQNERAFIWPLFNKSRVVMVLENDSIAHRNKVQEVVKLMEIELGEDWILHKHCKVYLYVSSQRITGCLVAEPIKEAFKLIASPDDGKQLKKETSSSALTSIKFGNIVLQREVTKRSRESEDRLDNGTFVFEEEAKEAVCGVRAIWVSPSNRRKGIATKLLDTARASFCENGNKMLEKSLLAFSQPSSMGRCFGSNYFGTCSFLVYRAQVIATQFS